MLFRSRAPPRRHPSEQGQQEDPLLEDEKKLAVVRRRGANDRGDVGG